MTVKEFLSLSDEQLIKIAQEAHRREILNNLRGSVKRCSNCAHDGQCEGLPFCGGKCWAPIDDEE